MTIFISYRRADSAGFAGRIFDRLSTAFGERNVFMDVDSIQPGQDFVSILHKRLAAMQAMLVVIDALWLTIADLSGRRRLDDPDDFVRLEIATALRQGIIVIPVLVGLGILPSASDLPEDLRELSHRQGRSLRHESFGRDVDALITSIREQIVEKERNDLDEFAREISREFDNRLSLRVSDEGMKLLVYIGSAETERTPHNSRLYLATVKKLIEWADVGFWMKHEGELQPDDFWTALLKTVADGIRFDLPSLREDLSDADVLRLTLEGS